MADFECTGTGGAVADGSAKVKFAATYTGREIDAGPKATRAKAWIDYEDIASVSEREFRDAVASATPAVDFVGPLYRGIHWEPKCSRCDFLPDKPRANRYNDDSTIALYLSTSVEGVVQELQDRNPCSSIWIQRFLAPRAETLFDARRFSTDSFVAAVFWFIEQKRDPPPVVGKRVGRLIGERFAGMIVPGVRAVEGAQYQNVVMLGQSGDWATLIDPTTRWWQAV